LEKNNYLCMDLKLIVIKLLSITPMHGYKLAFEIEKIFNKKPSNGALNPLFNSLEKQDLIISSESVESGKYKKIYSITSKGKKELFLIQNKIIKFIKK
jgi:DNA-binding PadR family transcriptional regulator